MVYTGRVASSGVRGAQASGKIPEIAWLPGVARRKLRLDAGVEIALLDWGGDGPLALLYHANGFCAGVWGLVAASLRQHYRVIAMDARGHGDSSRPAGARAYHWDRFAEDGIAVAERLLEESGRRSVALGLGHSFGGTSLLSVAARRPDLFERLILVDPVVPAPAATLDPARPRRVWRKAPAAANISSARARRPASVGPGAAASRVSIRVRSTCTLSMACVSVRREASSSNVRVRWRRQSSRRGTSTSWRWRRA